MDILKIILKLSMQLMTWSLKLLVEMIATLVRAWRTSKPHHAPARRRHTGWQSHKNRTRRGGSRRRANGA